METKEGNGFSMGITIGYGKLFTLYLADDQVILGGWVGHWVHDEKAARIIWEMRYANQFRKNKISCWRWRERFASQLENYMME